MSDFKVAFVLLKVKLHLAHCNEELCFIIKIAIKLAIVEPEIWLNMTFEYGQRK